MESANRREVVSQRLTVAPFESLTEFFDCFADDLFGLLDFHDCSPVSGASCPLDVYKRQVDDRLDFLIEIAKSLDAHVFRPGRYQSPAHGRELTGFLAVLFANR